jgi:ammonium transporter, Amt family
MRPIATALLVVQFRLLRAAADLKRRRLAGLGLLALCALPGLALADAEAAAPPSAETILFTTHNLWMMIATALVFLMHLGFACLEAGMTRAKNTVNVLFKNTLIPCIGILTYALVGFAIMYPGDGAAGGFFGFAGFGIGTDAAGLTPAYDEGYTYWTDFLFQGMFAATAATIVSGAVAERVKLPSFLVFSAIFVAIGYPMIGMWKWGGGFLDTLATPFYDFAGSTIVHSVGGWAALACVILLGARHGRYAGGRINAIPGHSKPLATMGVFLLWLGWFGFNGGSVLSADPGAVSLVLVNTNIAAAAGVVAATVATWWLAKKPDLSMVLNGALAGLVGITAGADVMMPAHAALVGGIAGFIVVAAVIAFDRIRIDDPVGAISVHLVCGIWGTLAVGLFGELAGVSQVFSQLLGIAVMGAFAFTFAFGLFFVLKKTAGVRVSEEEEIEGLDVAEHGGPAYVLSSGPLPGAGRAPAPPPVGAALPAAAAAD